MPGLRSANQFHQNIYQDLFIVPQETQSASSPPQSSRDVKVSITFSTGRAKALTVLLFDVANVSCSWQSILELKSERFANKYK